ncbi:MAG: hypothetical protein QXV35_03175 [Archaeoglobaceae archaeon]
MPVKIYDNEELAEKAKELRQRGYTYAEIARELGCSVYKAWTLLEDQRRVNSKKAILQELSKSIEELCGEFVETKKSIEDEVEELKKAIEEARKSVAEFESKKSEIDQIIEKMKNTEAFIAKNHIETLSWLRATLIHAGKKKSEECMHRNGEVCGKWIFHEEDQNHFSLTKEGEKYRLVLNDNNSFAFCGLCPYYRDSAYKPFYARR